MWGGTRLAGLFPDAAPQEPAQVRLAQVRIGEAWFGEIGDRRPLVKLLDVHDRLSVQVHPDDALASELHGVGSLGKHEAWIILEAAPDAHLLLGRDPNVEPFRVDAALENGEDVAPLLARVAVSPGDVLDVPPGTLHALMPGLLVWEVQQPSDLTYRVSDWGRNSSERPLHHAEARRATHSDAVAQRISTIDWLSPGHHRILAGPEFQIAAVIGPWSGDLATPLGATATLVTQVPTSAQFAGGSVATVGGVSMSALQSISAPVGIHSVSLPPGAALLIAEPGVPRAQE